MYTVRHGSGRDSPIEVEVFISDYEVGTRLIEMIKSQELEPDGSDLPDTLDFIDDTTEMEVEIYWGDEISNKAQVEISEMWDALTKLWENEEDADDYDKALVLWSERLEGLNT